MSINCIKYPFWIGFWWHFYQIDIKSSKLCAHLPLAMRDLIEKIHSDCSFQLTNDNNAIQFCSASHKTKKPHLSLVNLKNVRQFLFAQINWIFMLCSISIAMHKAAKHSCYRWIGIEFSTCSTLALPILLWSLYFLIVLRRMTSATERT